jgi:hypothetical protein
VNIGDYIRTPFGITKCINKQQIIIENDLFCETKYGYLYYLEDYDDEICNITDSNLDEYKHSANIIDLIEIGDYVNGKEVIDFMLENGKRKGIIVDADIWGFDIDEIKSIVTKEQFESMKYRIGE